MILSFLLRLGGCEAEVDRCRRETLVGDPILVVPADDGGDGAHLDCFCRSAPYENQSLCQPVSAEGCVGELWAFAADVKYSPPITLSWDREPTFTLTAEDLEILTSCGPGDTG